MNKKIFLSVGIVVIIIVGFFLVYSPSDSGFETEDFAKCLTDEGATMYGAEWCPHCGDQKKLFGSSFRYVNYINCQKYNGACIVAGIRGYPTWKIDGVSYPGLRNLEELSEISSCPL